MARAAPRYLFRDKIIVYPNIIEGGDRRDYDEDTRFELRCRLESGVKLRSAEGMHRQVGFATAWVPMSRRFRRRQHRRVRELRTGSFHVGSRVDSGFVAQPSSSLTLPIFLDSRRNRGTDLEIDHFAFLPEMRVDDKKSGTRYQIYDIFEMHSPRGPDHWKLILKDQRG